MGKIGGVSEHQRRSRVLPELVGEGQGTERRASLKLFTLHELKNVSNEGKGVCPISMAGTPREVWSKMGEFTPCPCLCRNSNKNKDFDTSRLGWYYLERVVIIFKYIIQNT